MEFFILLISLLPCYDCLIPSHPSPFLPFSCLLQQRLNTPTRKASATFATAVVGEDFPCASAAADGADGLIGKLEPEKILKPHKRKQIHNPGKLLVLVGVAKEAFAVVTGKEEL